MATESPMTMVESSHACKWLSPKDASVFGSSIKTKADFIHSRSGSAPPCMEGLVEAIGNISVVKDSTLTTRFDSSGNAFENHRSEEQCLSHPSYAACCVSNVNSNPRLPPRILPSQTGSCKENQGPEKQGSIEEASHMFEESSILYSGQVAALLSNRHKTLVDLIQEDFPRTPSPVFNLSHSTTNATTEDSVDLEAHAVPSIVCSIHTPNLSDSATNSARALEKDPLNLDSSNFISNDEVPSETLTNTKHSDGNKSSLEDRACSKHAGLKNNVSTNELMHTEKQNSRANKPEARRQKQEQYYVRNKENHSFTNGYAYQYPGAEAQVVPQGINNSQSYFGKLAHSHVQFSSFGIQPSMSSPGVTGSMHASSAAFMTPGDRIYPNIQPSGLFASQYGLEGYAVSSSMFAPYMAGYCSQGSLSLPYEMAYGPNHNGQATNVLSGERVPHADDFQNLSKFSGQHGLTLQPSYVDPHMLYYPHCFDDTYPSALQQNQLPSRGLAGRQFSCLASQETSGANACLDGLKIQPPVNGSLSIPSIGNMGIPGGSYFGNPSSMGFIMQFPALSLGSPTLPSSPGGGTYPVGGQNEMNIPLVSRGNSRYCFDQQGFRSFSDLKELRSIDSEKLELSGIAGHIVEFSIDQHGSRFIQQKLESCSAEEQASVFEEILPHASKLMTDVFGNYVIQKFLQNGSIGQRKKLAEQLSGRILSLSLQMYGCRVIQKALEVIELYQKIQLVQELDGHVMRCVHDQNGNHVIQKCIECIPTDKIQFIISAFQGQVSTLSTHPYGCRVVQRILEHCSDDQNIRCIVDEILESACVLAQDQYGNYVTQHVLERGTPHERGQIISKLTGKIVQLSQHKYASNVVEKCWEFGNEIEREALIEEIIQQRSENGNLLTMMKNQFANYVVQKILETSNDKHREILRSHIRVHINALKKYTYGKHIAARFEQLDGPGNEEEEV